MSKYTFKHYHKFDKDCDKLFKKCRTLKEDLELLKEILIDDLIYNQSKLPRNNAYFHVNRLKLSE